MKFKNTLQSPHGTRVFTQIKQASEVKERGFLDTTVHPQLPSRTWAVVNQGSTGAGIWVTLIALNLRQKQMALPVGISQRREFPMRYVHGNYPSWVSWHAPSSFVRKSLEWHVSWLGNESCFWIWKIWLQQARGKCLLLLPAGRSKAEGLDYPRRACFTQGKGGASGLKSLLLFCAGQGARGRLLIEKANQGWSRAVSWELGPRKGKECGNRKEKKQRQKLLFCCTKEGGDPRLLVTQEEAYLGKWESLSVDPFRSEANYGWPRASKRLFCGSSSFHTRMGSLV